MRNLLLLFLASLLALNSMAQEDLFALAQKESDSADQYKKVYTIATFKGTRLINGHSVETIGKGDMDFRIHHRFGELNSGINDLFGLDFATQFIGFDFGLSRSLNIGVSRSSVQKQYEAFVKFRLLQQSTGYHASPLSITAISSVVSTSDRNLKLTTTERLAFINQIIIARKFSESFSLQLMPTMIHFNMVPLTTDPNDLFSLGIGLRQKISKRVSVNGEYYHQFQSFAGTTNSLALGVDIETGGHVFQLHFTNSRGTTAPNFIHNTTGKWDKGDIRFGFNVSRVFALSKKNKGKW
ncbi:MAG: DUF5777 family beta-barrel protein [Chitinophagaceae bacterium]